ncbi:uncharacterized protein LOC123564827 [Mercenaria mercenaria]|uniref:uncharacterized protein LOC123564827 n=1 Tax=Mercenaria mercenaria TaxID=6596 RepID=UPI00234F032A|nr:uncharacterized protein LOC123564827 [Mercenaria mercenaria]XP_053408397.1 uncharacterized protein LOC123564827 [Mercenaria mercenaria]
MSRKTWSPSKENLLLQHLSKLERSPSTEDHKKYGSQCSINLEDNLIDLPTEPKRRRIMADDTPSSMGSQVSSQMSSRSHSPSLSEFLDDSLMSTPNASPSGTLKEHFRRKYRKDELWAAIETNYKYLMDKGIIEACQTPESDVEEIKANSTVSFGEFLKQYKELSDWLKTIQTALQQKAASTLALSEKYLNQSYYEEMQRSPKLQLCNDYGRQLKQCQPVLTEEVDVFLKEVNTQWETILKVVTPTNLNQDPQSVIKDLEADLECLKKWLDGIEDHLRSQMTSSWQYEELEGVLNEHKIQQSDIESHSRVISAVLKLSDQLHDNNLDDDFLESAAHNLERRWHGIWLQSLEWQCRLEDAISRKKGIFNTGPYQDPFSNLRDYTDDDDDYDSQDVTSGGEDSFPGLGYRGDFIQSPPLLDSSNLSQSSDFDKSSGKDSAVASESEQKTNSDMSENYQDLSVSTSSDSEREFLRQIKMKKHDSRDIGYGSESQSDELDGRYKGITFSGISGRVRKTSTKCGDYYATVAVDTSSTDKTEGWISTNPDQTCDDSDINAQIQQVLKQEEPEMEDIRYLIDQADIMVQQGNTFNKSFSPQRTVAGTGEVATESQQESLSSSSSSGAREMVDKGVGTIESSCDASDEESGESDGHQEDGTETMDSVIASEYTSDEMRNNVRDYSKLPKLYDTNSLRTRLKGSRKDRPWSVIEMPDVIEQKPLSNSESAIDKLTAYSDSEIPSNKSRKSSQSLSPTFPRHRIRKAQCVQRPVSRDLIPKRSQIGAKRKLNLTIPVSPHDKTSGTESSHSASCIVTPTNNVYIETVHMELEQNRSGVNSETKELNSENSASGNASVVPLIETCTSEDEALTPLSGKSGLISTLQNARFKSSGSSQEETDTQADPTVVSEIDDANNDGNFSENAWDNYQAALYPTGSEDQPEDALTWEPGEMEFDDEFSLPQSTILATLLARRSEEESFSGVPPKLVPSSKGNFEDSDSDIEDLHHVLEESRMQLKVADRSLKKKRKDPLKTGLYLNPGKYGELLATIETNIKCLEAISQHLDQADVTEADIQTIQDLLYQWEKLHALASDRRNQSQEVKTMYATFLSVEGVATEGVPEAEKRKFKNIEDLKANVLDVQDKLKFLQCQKQMLGDLRNAATTFSTQNPSVNMAGFLCQIQNTEDKIDELMQQCTNRVMELEHIQYVWQEYKETRCELEFLLTQERELLERIAFSQEMDDQGSRIGVEADLKKLVNNLAVYEEKLITLQRLRAELMDISDEEMQTDLTASIADIRNQLYVAQRQCQDMMDADLLTRELQEKDVEQDSGMEVEDRMEVDEVDFMFQKVEAVPMETEKPRFREVAKPKKIVPKLPVKKESKVPDWLKSFPLQAIAFAVFLGLMYLFAPKSLHKLLDFSLRFSPELKYVNGPPPM